MRDLKEIPTCELVKELVTREGVEKTVAEPYELVNVEADDPAIILVGTD